MRERIILSPNIAIFVLMGVSLLFASVAVYGFGLSLPAPISSRFPDPEIQLVGYFLAFNAAIFAATSTWYSWDTGAVEGLLAESHEHA